MGEADVCSPTFWPVKSRFGMCGADPLAPMASCVPWSRGVLSVGSTVGGAGWLADWVVIQLRAIAEKFVLAEELPSPLILGFGYAAEDAEFVKLGAMTC
ncbi:hypothetical protein LEN26_011767 [Aphanomyces euteiches]|nr:hypothetical protein LEN26_011767 [Aphanomyces euteiches]KAH9122145.1 hypothetical protein AeMF1_006447 [Aphanomyces euteiches]KAH9183628.1 hypothetical protein AeNC1_014395 [Aphanomyces euteiches]